MLIRALVYHRPRLFHHLRPFSTTCHSTVPEDWSEAVPRIYHTCMGNCYGMTTVSGYESGR